MQRRTFLQGATGLAAAGLIAGAAMAQSWPAGPVRMILSQPPGSGPDNVARLLSEPLRQLWKQSVVVENRPGGQNVIGALAAAGAPADGYTYYFGTTAALVTNPLLLKDLKYQPAKDFTPVAFVARSPFVFFVRHDSPVENIQDLVEQARKQNGQFSLGHEGPRTFGGMIAQLFNTRSQSGVNLVAFSKVSSGISDLMGGHVDAMVTGIASAAQLAQDGRLRVLATTSDERLPAWPDVPALKELYPGFAMEGWQLLVAPAGTPADVVDRVNRDVNAALSDPAMIERIEALGQIPGHRWSVAQVETFLRDEHTKWGAITSEIGIAPE